MTIQMVYVPETHIIKVYGYLQILIHIFLIAEKEKKSFFY